MAKSDDVDLWRRHLLEAEAELADKTRQLEEAQLFFCGAINRLARVANNEAVPIQAEIDKVKKAAGNPKNIAPLKGAIDDLITKIIQSESVGVGGAEGVEKASPKVSHGSELHLLLERLSSDDNKIPQVLEMKQRVSNISSATELSIALDDVAMVWRQSMSSPDAFCEDPSQFCAGLISEILYQLLEKISFPLDVTKRLSQLQKTLEDGVTMAKWPKMLDDISDLATDVQMKINRERLDIEAFLKQVTGRLQDLDGYILGTQDQHAEAWRHGKALGDAVKSEMQNLVTNANDALDMDVLKEQIQTRLATIESHVNGFRETEKSQHQNSNEDVKRLMARLGELELESQTLKARVKKERMQAQIDTLTGIANRLGYDHRIAQEYARWKRFHNSLCLVIWDIDFFKRINDEFGHASGDKALKSVAMLLSDKIRETDYLARYGGEEFVLIMPGASLAGAKEVADKLRRVIESASFHFNGKPVSITISAGIAEFAEEDTARGVFERADKALYAAKEAGRNCVMLDNSGA